MEVAKNAAQRYFVSLDNSREWSHQLLKLSILVEELTNFIFLIAIPGNVSINLSESNLIENVILS